MAKILIFTSDYATGAHKMKILLCGDINSGKSTLIQKLVSDMGRKPRGYITVRMPEDEDGVSHVYLYDISSPPKKIEDAQVIMRIRGKNYDRHPEYMSSIAAPILESIPEGSLVVLDELGTLEEHEDRFKAAVMKILSGRYDVLAAVKAQNTDFLRDIRRHPDCELYIITPENRDALYAQLRREYKI